MDITALVRAIERGRSSDVFGARLSREEWQRLGGVLQRVTLRPGQLLLRRGDTEACAYLVESGLLQVFVGGGSARGQRVATFGQGSLVGEPGLFGATPRLAHVEAMTPCVVWALFAPRLHALSAEAPGLVLEVLRAAGAVMALRLRDNREHGIPVT